MIYLFEFFRIYLLGFLDLSIRILFLVPINSTLCYCFWET